jgi:hypothetical protein
MSVYSDTQYAVRYVKRIVARASYVPVSYSKGSTSYGLVTAPEGSFPEGGTLIEGSATGSYCILLVNGTYYYYVKN